jgi:hypothetical protein
MILEKVFNIIKQFGPCDVHKVAEELGISEANCRNILFELQSRGAVEKEQRKLGEESNSCVYIICIHDFHDDSEFCSCKVLKLISSDTESSEFGYWDTCCVCGKHLENGFHYYNHYDDEDHDDMDY